MMSRLLPPESSRTSDSFSLHLLLLCIA
jgi:hypothetical protein